MTDPKPVVPRPSLRSAKRRVMQAVHRHMYLQQIENTVRAVEDTVRATADRASWERGEPLEPTFHFEALAAVPTGEAPLLAGEVIYHLRTSLDYVAYNLAWLDSGSRQKDTAFPVLDLLRDWDRTRKRRLKGVSTEHCDVVREYQPFNGCTWTEQLRTLSNDDKHNFIVDVAAQASGRMVNDASHIRPDPQDPTRVIVQFDGSFQVNLVLIDGRPVVPLLGELMTEVALVLDRLQNDFGEHDELTVHPH